jgi:APA family basic amino acid/polyamine antiporter
MARDGLLPQGLGAIHAKRNTPHRATLLAGALVGGLAAFSSMDEMVDLSNVGTLFVFTMVCAGVTVLRLRDPDRARPFKVPGGAFVVPTLGTASCVFLMWYLPPTSWWRFAAWMTAGAAVYAVYGYRHSVLGQAQKRDLNLGVVCER